MIHHFMRFMLFTLILFLSLSVMLFAGTTGKIAGFVTDAATGEPLPGVNVLLEGTLLGAATDLDGYYVILNIPPGVFTVQAQMVGYAVNNISDVRVRIDQTTKIDLQMREETMELSTIEVVAERPVIEQDVAASRANISVEEIQSIPIVSVNEAVGLQAGIRGLEVRGGGEDETAFVVNGVTLQDGRTNNPITTISYSAVEEIQVQSGGFTAEYSNFRSGLVNVVTKEGGRDNYSFSLIGRYSAPAPKHFGPSPNSPDSYWIRPYVDNAVAWSGTKNGTWGRHLQDQYPEFKGWNSISEETLRDNNPSNDLTPEAAQQVFLWQHRRQLDIQEPDYVLDFSFGGPVPYISKDLGNLRFNLSYRSTQKMYLIPLSRDGYTDYTINLKLTSDIAPGMKLMFDAGLIKQEGSNYSRSGFSGIFNETWRIAQELSNGPKFIDARMFNTDYWNPTEIDFTSLGIRFNHALSAKTFYEVRFSRVSSDYWTVPATRRDTSRVYRFGESYYVDESPINWEERSTTGIDGMRMGAGMSNSRDTSFVAIYSMAGDITSQIDRNNNIKAGFEFVLTDYRPNYARFDKFLIDANEVTKFERTPIRAGIYVQDKLEFKGMIATAGLRLDYFNAGGKWYKIDDPYTSAFSSANFSNVDQLLPKEQPQHTFSLSPRLSVSFPVSEYSKLYFNYGHFRSLPDYDDLYLQRYKTSPQPQLVYLGDPNLPQEKTIAYELGYEHSIFDLYLLRLAGYYKDVADQTASVTYVSDDETVQYDRLEPIFYEDIRGFELTFSKKGGNWIRGFVNYTYQVESSGYFGVRDYSENPVTQVENVKKDDPAQTKTKPRPYARLNIDFFTPLQFGPELAGIRPLEEWRINVLGNWRTGQYDTWVGGQTVPGIKYNVQWRDYWNVDLRFSKNFNFGPANIELFVDIQNVFNFKYMSPGGYGFVDAKDKLAYFRSLHLPDNTEGKAQFGYVNIPGDDQPGDYRNSGVEFVPIVAATNYTAVTNPLGSDELYYFTQSFEGFHGSGYYEYIDDGSGMPKFQKVDQGRVDKILEDKAYIDMPNLTFFTFLDPRQIFWGIRLSLNL